MFLGVTAVAIKQCFLDKMVLQQSIYRQSLATWMLCSCCCHLICLFTKAEETVLISEQIHRKAHEHTETIKSGWHSRIHLIGFSSFLYLPHLLCLSRHYQWSAIVCTHWSWLCVRPTGWLEMMAILCNGSVSAISSTKANTLQLPLAGAFLLCWIVLTVQPCGIE